MDKTVQKQDSSVLYKNTVAVSTFQQVADILPVFNRISCDDKEKFLYYTANLDLISDAVNKKEKIAVEGGPCLFSADEVNVIVQAKNGDIKKYDFVGVTKYDNTPDISLDKYLLSNRENIAAITFVNHKKALTMQEYLQLRYPVEIAAALNAPLIIPIPDMSYRKYMISTLEPVSNDIKQHALAVLDQVLYDIVQFYLAEINRLQKQFFLSSLTVLHLGTPTLLDVWYRKRERYISSRKFLKNLTGRKNYFEAVKDYVTMPALPLYLFDISNVLQVDSVYETDSYRKCRKRHKHDLNLSCLLISELLSKNGIDVEYNAPRKFKTYR